MSGYANHFHEEHRIDQNLYPAWRSGAQTTPWVSMRDYHRGAFIVQLGQMQAPATVDAVLQQATNVAGGGVKPLVPTKAITQLTQAGGDGDQTLIVEFQTEELDVNGGFDCVRLSVTVGAAAVLLSVVGLRFEPRFEEVDASNLAEIVT